MPRSPFVYGLLVLLAGARLSSCTLVKPRSIHVGRASWQGRASLLILANEGAFILSHGYEYVRLINFGFCSF